jgi:fatty-acyl-CoA synthase
VPLPHGRSGEPISSIREEFLSWIEHRAVIACRIEIRDVLARTATGKLQKFQLRDPYWEGRDHKIN